jgi:hypothetical protein
VKNAKLGILACGAVLLVLLVSDHFLDMLKADATFTLIMLVSFVAPTAMGALAMKKPPLLPWQAAVSLAGFALATVKLRLWDTLPHIADIPGIRFKIIPIAVVLGIVFSVLGLVKREKA